MQHPAPPNEEHCTYVAFVCPNRSHIGYKRLEQELLQEKNIPCSTFDELRTQYAALLRQYGNDPRLLVGTSVTGRKACLEAGIHDQYPVCPTWATGEERAWFEQALAAHRATATMPAEKETPFSRGED